MARYKSAGLRRKAEVIDFDVLFVEAGRRIVRNAAVLDAYRKSTGFSLRSVRTMEAAARLKEAQEHCRHTYNFIGGERGSHHHASGQAMCYYLAQWWVTELRDVAPDSLGDGDEFFSRETVRKMVENYGDPVPDAVGKPFDKWEMP